ncbi:MAG: J domain-containing protein [Chthoniobacterales bacterium]
MGSRRVASGKHSNGSAVVLIDQTPLRRSIAAECTKAMTCLDELRVRWHRFDREDRPAFIRWRAREFGALLSEAREVENRIRDAQALVHEVEMEMRRFFQDAHSAYMRVMFRRQNPGNVAEEETAASEFGGPPGRKLSDFEKEALFQDWVQKFMGTHPDKLDDDVYSKTFEAFKSHMFVNPSTAASSSRPGRSGANPPPHSANGRNGSVADEDAAETASVDSRVKELYRTLVRRLHPDLRADGSAGVSALWHDVQEAYAAADVAQMEILLALCDIQADELGEGTTISKMRSVLAELQRSIGALEKMLLEAEGEDAWEFARSGPNEELKLQVERELKTDMASRKSRLEVFTRTIAEWARGSAPNRRARSSRTSPVAQ